MEIYKTYYLLFTLRDYSVRGMISSGNDIIEALTRARESLNKKINHFVNKSSSHNEVDSVYRYNVKSSEEMIYCIDNSKEVNDRGDKLLKVLEINEPVFTNYWIENEYTEYLVNSSKDKFI